VGSVVASPLKPEQSLITCLLLTLWTMNTQAHSCPEKRVSGITCMWDPSWSAPKLVWKPPPCSFLPTRLLSSGIMTSRLPPPATMVA
jgi:hypothetical protein